MPRIESYLRFGPLNPKTLLVACRGGRPQRVEGGWFSWFMEDFRTMSGLEFLATENRAVAMPDIDPGFRGQSVDQLEQILQREQPDKAYFFGFSRWGSEFVETISKSIQFTGAVICSGVDIPGNRNVGSRVPIKSLVIVGEREVCGRFGLRSCRKTADEIYAIFSQLGECELWTHDLPGGRLLPGHTWPKHLNAKMVDFLEIPA